MTMPDSVSDAAGVGVAGKPRDVNYDLLRVVAMCLVIGVHVINNYMPVKMTLAGSAETVRFVCCSRCSWSAIRCSSWCPAGST